MGGGYRRATFGRDSVFQFGLALVIGDLKMENKNFYNYHMMLWMN